MGCPMAANEPGGVVALFDDRTHAERALDELIRAGFRPDQVGMAVRDGGEAVEAPPLEPDTKESEGAVTGVVAGGTLGGLVGAALAAGMVPGVGPVVAGGLLLGALGGAAAGAAGGGLLGTLIGLNVPEEHARHFERHFHSGRTLVVVHAGDRSGEAADVLRRHGGHDGSLPPGPVPDEESEAPAGGRARVARLEDAGGEPGAGSGTVFPGE
jgi:hypothetical protein